MTHASTHRFTLNDDQRERARHHGASTAATRRHLSELLPRVDAFDRDGYVPQIIAAFSDAARADELEAFVKANVAEDALDKARQMGEEIRFKAALKQRELPVIDHWIAAQLAK